MKIELDPKSKTLTASAILSGETDAIEVRARYTLREANGACALRIESAEFNREWMTILARRFADGREIDVPAGLARFLELIER